MQKGLSPALEKNQVRRTETAPQAPEDVHLHQAAAPYLFVAAVDTIGAGSVTERRYFDLDEIKA
jgi:hypothetical protein